MDSTLNSFGFGTWGKSGFKFLKDNYLIYVQIFEGAVVRLPGLVFFIIINKPVFFIDIRFFVGAISFYLDFTQKPYVTIKTRRWHWSEVFKKHKNI